MDFEPKGIGYFLNWNGSGAIAAHRRGKGVLEGNSVAKPDGAPLKVYVKPDHVVLPEGRGGEMLQVKKGINDKSPSRSIPYVPQG